MGKPINPGVTLDLNLLKVLVSVLDIGNVSRAAQHLGMSQPAVSTALGRLRSSLGDPLFVRTGRGMQATPRALELADAVRTTLTQLDDALHVSARFEPRESRKTFVLAMSDVGEMVFLPRIMEQLAHLAPHARVRSVSMPHAQLEQGLSQGQVDLAVGYFPDLQGNNMFAQRLFTHHFVCLMRADHPVINKRLSREQFSTLPHAVVHSEGRSQELFERYLRDKSIERQVLLTTPHFMSIPFILERTNLLAVVPHAMGLLFARTHANIKWMHPPMPLPSFDLKQYWHRTFHEDSASRWLRVVIAKLFNDAVDEWRMPTVKKRRKT